MKLSVSNIGWDAKQDTLVYDLMKQYNYIGLEIAPTRIFSESPYDKLEEAREWAIKLKEDYGFTVPSMQSIWYGRQEKLFGTKKERRILIEYTKKAIDFAVAIKCKNLVFGCPKNRNMQDGADQQVAKAFFKEIGDYAASQGTTIGLEANPPIYNTNYINDTSSALELIQNVDSKGFRLNLDIGTMIQNEERIDVLYGKVFLINHVHISEPKLRPILERKLHGDLLQLLKQENYQGFISIEMGKQDDIGSLENALSYVRELCSNLSYETA